MKRACIIMLAALTGAAMLAAISACTNLRDDTTFSDTAEAAAKKATTEKSELLPTESADKHPSAEAALSEAVASEITIVESNILESAAAATNPPEAAATTTVVPDTTAPPEISTTATLPETIAQTTAVTMDVDLTTLSSTMVYAEVYNMLVSPNDYIGKIIRMKGLFAYYEDPQTGNLYFACIIADATACCSQGIEFTLADAYTYPDDYPELGSEITVVGEFETYTENGYSYCRLANASLDDA